MIDDFLKESTEYIMIYLTVNDKLECNLLHYELEIRLSKHQWESELLKVGGNNVLVDVITPGTMYTFTVNIEHYFIFKRKIKIDKIIKRIKNGRTCIKNSIIST